MDGVTARIFGIKIVINWSLLCANHCSICVILFPTKIYELRIIIFSMF